MQGLPKSGKAPKHILALDRIQDPGNLGNLFRSGLAGEYEVMWLASGADPLNQKVLRSSAGSVLHMPFERIGDSSSSSIEMLVSKLNIAIDDNYQVVGTISPNKITDKKVKPYWELDWDLPTVLVLGNEGSGVHASIEACCTDFVTLPHSSLVDSLNVASAAVPLLLERQRVKMVKGIQKKS
jgi:TrmH family RNA methyltransferase